MDLDRYLSRIHYRGPVRADLEVLKAVHRQHALHIAYENLDVLLGIPVTQEPQQLFEKIVTRGRGGWCYEMNGLLGWALSEIGFVVHRRCGGVMRATRGDEAYGNHLVLQVELAQRWLADVGLGDGLLEPAPLREGSFSQGSRTFRLEKLSEHEWRFHNYAGAIPPDFDFREDGPNEPLLRSSCDQLQSDAGSVFRQNLVCQRQTASGPLLLLGRVLISGAQRRKRLLTSPDELEGVLTNLFGIRVPDLAGLWPGVVGRHEALFGDRPLAEIEFGTPPQPDPE